MKMAFFLLTVCMLQVSAKTFSQKVSFSGKQVPLKTVLESIEKQSDYVFFYKSDLLKSLPPVTVQVKNGSIEELLEACLKGLPIRYSIRDKTISLRAAAHIPVPLSILPASPDTSIRKVSGIVKDEDGAPVAGATIMIRGSSTGTNTGSDGRFSITLATGQHTLIVSYVGMKQREVSVQNRSQVEILLQREAGEIGEAVVTGFYKKSKSTFTGAAITFTGEELKKIAPTNLIQALAAVTPGMMQVENKAMGSNPNALPEILLRGVTSFANSNTGQAVNQPLIVRDGTIISLQDLYDMNINEIASITVLKDASAAAVYGAKAANGVIVIERKRAENGKMRLAYNATASVQMPDFRDYNILNAPDKLEYERLAGLYTSANPAEQYQLDSLYNERYKEVKRGNFTDWMKQPARTGHSLDHSLRVYGGSNATRYELNVRMGNTDGVMKGDYRKRMGLGFVLEYIPFSSLTISNRTTYSQIKSQASPYGSFSKYTRANPYERMYDEFGNLVPDLGWGQENPLYEASLSSFNRGQTQSLSNDFDIRWQINNQFRLTAHMNLGWNSGNQHNYLSPLSRVYKDVTDPTLRGSYTESGAKGTVAAGNLVLSYNKRLPGNSMLMANAGANIMKEDQLNNTIRGIGFFADDLRSLGFAARYPDGEKPHSTQSLSADLGYFVNLTYSLWNRFYFDGVYQISGSSRFGANNRYGQFWSAGFGWNIHNEKFIDNSIFNLMKLRGSAGYTGKVNFAPFQAMTIYRYQNTLEYKNGMGALPLAIGNPDLRWERTMNYNMGFDLSILNRRVNLTYDMYVKRTTDLLIDKTIAPSAGVITGKDNLGEMENKGIELRLDAMLLQQKNLQWQIGLNMTHNTNRILKISNALKKQNDDYNSIETGAPVPQFVEGESVMAIKVVRSAGIDPVTGQEIYIKRNGEYTLVYDPTDKIVAGDGMPRFTGTLYSVLTYKRFSMSPYFSYNYGGYIYNTTRSNKIEGSDPHLNADQRVFDSRWKKPGDIAAYRNIADQSAPRQSTRFVEKENTFSLTRLNFGYELPGQWLSKAGISKASVGLSVNDVFRLSTVRIERGTEYLYSRGFDFILNVVF